jgi:predicted choloylglycine hydrolase
MAHLVNRRGFLGQVGAYTTAAGLGWLGRTTAAAAEAVDWPKAPDNKLAIISGKPRERGRQYGKQFADAISEFLDKEIVKPFGGKSTLDDMLRYGGQCAKAIKDYSPEIADEMEGMAEGSKLRLEELVVITLHEEMYHQGVLPKADHCTAVAAGPPDTDDKNTYVGQTWDWYVSLYGASQMLLWKRPEGPSLLTYSYPGLWVGAGMNSEGIALCWTSTQGLDIPGPRVGIPSYVLIAQMLYQKTLKDAIEEAKRAQHAGWFTFVLADREGNLANVEGSPKDGAIEHHKGHLVRVYYGSRKMTGTAEGKPVAYHERCQKVYEMLGEAKGKVNGKFLQDVFSNTGICSCEPSKNGRDVRTIDAMLFNTSKREALVTRGPIGKRDWKRFTFEEDKPK